MSSNGSRVGHRFDEQSPDGPSPERERKRSAPRMRWAWLLIVGVLAYRVGLAYTASHPVPWPRAPIRVVGSRHHK